MCKMDILKHYGLVTEKKKTKVDAETSAEPHEETSMNQMAWEHALSRATQLCFMLLILISIS